MHPRQAKLVAGATEVADKIEPKQAAAPLLWQYTTPEGEVFYLDTRHMTIRSPFNGKTFTARPQRITPSQVGQYMRDQANTPVEEPFDLAGYDPSRMAAEEEPSEKTASEDPWKA